MQSSSLKVTLPLVVFGLLTPDAPSSAEARLQLLMPRAEPRPYVAVWLENARDHSFAGNLAVWYDTAKRGNRGTRWLPDLHQWWRKSGGVPSLAVDNVTGATRSAGVQSINVGGTRAMASLAPGQYEVVVEVVREHGDHDLVRVPMSWPPKAAQELMAQGRVELGIVRLTISP